MKKKISQSENKSNYLAIYFDDPSGWAFLQQLFQQPKIENQITDKNQDANPQSMDSHKQESPDEQENNHENNNLVSHSQEPNSDLDNAMVERNEEEQEQDEFQQNSNLIDNELKLQRINEHPQLQQEEEEIHWNQEENEGEDDDDDDRQLGGLMQYLPGDAETKANHDDINFEPDEQEEGQSQEKIIFNEGELQPQEFEVSPVKEQTSSIDSNEQPQLLAKPRFMLDEKLRKSYTEVHNELQQFFKKQDVIKKSQTIQQEDKQNEISIEISIGGDENEELVESKHEEKIIEIKEEALQKKQEQENNPNAANYQKVKNIKLSFAKDQNDKNQKQEDKNLQQDNFKQKENITEIKEVQLKKDNYSPGKQNNSILINERKNSQHYKKDKAVNEKPSSCSMCIII